ncbi:hypothetical protein RZN05_19730 [Sphingomonas sp. HF-S4]|uniref:Microcin J25-processing protein McjB C-terminal domain-containing protein n=1 Tax=Sphingomonas agrestis TaxID=3080540 RepID=A0ABU3YDM1_9SPHN|nr:hypothetical protein [Sphingomonas sp. HF-S4]MDV3459237.1 hypothetical protein [Sphingomonas sp. HF-S4]
MDFRRLHIVGNVAARHSRTMGRGRERPAIGIADLDRQIADSARRLMAFLEENKASEVLDYPFGYSYPRNCCESASIIFMLLLQERYGVSGVTIVRGTKPRLWQHHYWVRVRGLCYDLTAHQFAGRRPIIGVERHSFFATWPHQRATYQEGFVDSHAVIDLFRRGVIPF